MTVAYLERFHDIVITASGPKMMDSYRLVGEDGQVVNQHAFRTQKAAREIAKAKGLELRRRVIEPARSRLEIAMEDAA